MSQGRLGRAVLSADGAAADGALPADPLFLGKAGDQVIRENPASRGTETSAEDLVTYHVIMFEKLLLRV